MHGLFGEAELDAEPRRRGKARKRRPPRTLGECEPGDVVTLRVVITARISDASFGRVVTEQGESELFGLPAGVGVSNVECAA